MKRSHWLVFLAAISITGLGAAERSGKGVPSEDRKRLLSAKMTVVRSTGTLPAKTKEALAALFGQKTLNMAEPDQPFQVGDAIAPGPPLPGRRLIFAAFDDALCVIHYERGGVAHLYEVVAFGLEKGKDPVFRWGMRAPGRLEDLAALREAVNAGKLHEPPAVSW